MNVMKKAHEMTRDFFKKVPSSKMSYAGILKENLKYAHKEYKAMQAQVKDAQEQMTVKASNVKELLEQFPQATGFSIVGTVMSEGNTVYVGESSGSEVRMQSDANYYMSKANGYTKQDLYLELYGVHGVTKSFKIVN